jgi:iron complex outermembrane receptor protein
LLYPANVSEHKNHLALMIALSKRQRTDTKLVLCGYGTEAIGGVIHIITKGFGRTAKKHTANAQLVAGEFGLLNVQAGGTYVTPKTTISGGLLSNHASGQPQRGINGYFDLTTASLSFSTLLAPKWTLAARSAYDYRRFAAQNFCNNREFV